MNPITNLHQGQNKIIVSMGYDSITTNITLASGHGIILPDPSITSYNLIWRNASDYLSPTDDPSAEVVKCIAKFGDTLVIMRSQQQTLASSKNIPGKLYNMVLLPDTLHDNLDTNLDTLSYYNEPQLHGKTKHDATTIDGGLALPIGQLPAHGIGAHTGTIGDHQGNLTGTGTNTHAQIDTAITASIGHIALNGTSVHGLGTMSTQNVNAVSIIGGSITGITDIAVVDGGTGASTAAAARTNLELAAGLTGDIWVEKAGDTMTGALYNTNETARKKTRGTFGVQRVASNKPARAAVLAGAWTARTSPDAVQWRSVTWSPELGLFAAVAYTGAAAQQIMTSPDGITWTARTSPDAVQWRSVTWSPELGLFAAVASDGTTSQQIMTSPDGITWTARTSPNAVQWFSITWSPELGLFAAVAYTGAAAQQIMTSPDGITWTARTSANAVQWQVVTWSPELGLFAAVANTGTAAQQIMTSFPVNTKPYVRKTGDTMTGALSITSSDAASATALTVTQQDTASAIAATIVNAGTGDGLFIDQNGNGVGLHIDNDGTANSITVEGTTASDFVVLKSGNVGIGTATPGAPLHTVYNNSNVDQIVGKFMVKSITGGAERGIGFRGGGYSGSTVGIQVIGTGNRFGILDQDGTENLTILDTGNVGIGTTSPSQTLEVNGDVKVVTGLVIPVGTNKWAT